MKRLAGEPDEAKALIENALGFSLAAQKNYESAVTLQAGPQGQGRLSVALNNLGFAQEKLLQIEEAMALYKRTLELEPKNATASKRLKKLQKRTT